MDRFRNIWETLNEGTNMQGFCLIVAGGLLACHGHENIGSGIVTGGFTLLNNSKKRENGNGNGKSEAASK